MEGVLHGLEGIFEVLFIIAIGVVLSKKGWFGSNMSAVFSKLVMKVSLPLYMLCQMEKDFTHDSLIRIAPDLILPFASIFLAISWPPCCQSAAHPSRSARGICHLLFHCQYDFHRSAGQPGPLWNAERAIGYALLHG